MIPVHVGHPNKTKPVGYVSEERAQEWVTNHLARARKSGKAIQLVKRRVPPPLTKLTPESLRMITIAAEQATKCQGGLMNPR
jgi:hypothetical protein